MTTIMAGLFPTPEAAHDAAQVLTAQGVPAEDVGLVGGNAHGRRGGHSEAADNAVTGAEAGPVAGGATGFLLGAVALAIPVVGPEAQATRVAQILQRHGATRTTFGGMTPEAAARARQELAELPPAPPDVHFQSAATPTQVGEDPIQEIALGRESR